VNVHSWYHGTIKENLGSYDLNVSQIINGFSIDPKRGKSHSDFGRAFYLTTGREQAIDWANSLVVKRPLNSRSARTAALLRFDVDISLIASNSHVVFVRDSIKFRQFVQHCRVHGTHPFGGFDIVYGPVTNYPFRSIFLSSDQIAICSEAAASKFDPPTLELLGEQSDGRISTNYEAAWSGSAGASH
jgi:hypothetical protein